VLSSVVRADPEVAAHLSAAETRANGTAEQARLKGFGDAAFEVWRIQGA
jgi:hypothetical protein